MYAICDYNRNNPVISGLSLTPADVYNLTSQGLPVKTSQQADEYFLDGDTNPSIDVPLEFSRGVDINTLWETQRDTRKKVHKLEKLYHTNINID